MTTLTPGSGKRTASLGGRGTRQGSTLTPGGTRTPYLTPTGTLRGFGPADTFAGTGTVALPVIPGTMVAIEARDVASITGIVAQIFTGTLLATEAKDAFSGTGILSITGTLAATDGVDTAAILALLAYTGTLAATDPIDVGSGPVAAEGIYSLLLETGGVLLKEDFGRIQLDVGTGRLLKQDGFVILKEDGFAFLLEGRLTPVIKTELGGVLYQENGAAISNEEAPWPSTAILDTSGNGFTDPDGSYVTEP